MSEMKNPQIVLGPSVSFVNTIYSFTYLLVYLLLKPSPRPSFSFIFRKFIYRKQLRLGSVESLLIYVKSEKCRVTSANRLTYNVRHDSQYYLTTSFLRSTRGTCLLTKNLPTFVFCTVPFVYSSVTNIR